MALGDADLEHFFLDGVEVIAGGVRCMANLDWPDSVETLSGQFTPGAVVAKPYITYPVAKLNLRQGQKIRVDGVDYLVCHMQRKDDGKIAVAELNKVTQ